MSGPNADASAGTPGGGVRTYTDDDIEAEGWTQQGGSWIRIHQNGRHKGRKLEVGSDLPHGWAFERRYDADGKLFFVYEHLVTGEQTEDRPD